MYSYGDHKNLHGNYPLVAVAIDKDKGSQNALKWAIDNLVTKGQALVLVHVNTKATPSNGSQDDNGGFKQPTEQHMKDLFLPFRCYCRRKDIQCKDVLLEDHDVAKSIIEFISQAAIEKIVIGAQSRNAFVRFRSHDTPSTISKGAPDFCTVFVISKGKVSSLRNAVRAAPTVSPLLIQIQSQESNKPDQIDHHSHSAARMSMSSESMDSRSLHQDSIRSPFSRGLYGSSAKSYADLSFTDSDISFVSSSGRPSCDRAFTPRLSNGSDLVHTPLKSMDSYSTGNDYSSVSQSSVGTGTSWSSMTMDDVEVEMKRLRLELKQTMEMYNQACKEAITAKQKAGELQRWKTEEEQKLEEAKMAEGAAIEQVEKEKAKCQEAIEQAQAQQKLAEQEAQKRLEAEEKVLQECEEKKKALYALEHSNIKYRRYTIDEIEVATEYFAENRKIGEGGYGPVYKCYLDHTAVAVKVLRPDAAQGRSQFQQEVEILSCIRHPNMVLLMGACPEYGCLVYEYMSNGSLDDRLFRRGNTPPIPWQFRFRIAAEIATGLLFLHQTKPEPLVHRDLKPGNILLDHNYNTKISDVGLARLVPPSIADTVTQYRMTSTAGTFCYIDPEYQQTGMLGVKSDIYSLGIMLLQIITAKPPMGLTHHVTNAIENGTFADMLDPAVTDWPVEEAQKYAEISLQCAELRRKDRPDLGTVILPELNRLRVFAEETMIQCSVHSSPFCSQASLQDGTCGLSQYSGCSSRTQSSTESTTAE